MRRLLFLLVAVPALLLASTPPAGAQQSAVEEAARALRSDPVYVHPDARPSISGAQAGELRDRIQRARTPIFVAVLPSSALREVGGQPSGAPRAVYEALGARGTYATVLNGSFRVGSTELPGEAGRLATQAAQSNDDLGSALLDFVTAVDRAATGSPSARERGGESEGTSGNGLLLLVLAGGAVFAYFAFRRRSRERRALERARSEAMSDISDLGHDVLRLEPEVTLHPEAGPDYNAGVDRYTAAQKALERAEDVVDVRAVQRVVAEGRYAMDRARARIEGREPPPPPPELATEGPRGLPPVELDENGQPTYRVPQDARMLGMGGPWMGGGGWYGGGGMDLLTGILLGQVLTGGFGGWGHHGPFGGYGGGYGGDGGGDFGGGDWGGGGGGDFGGGDFGGGGGGDF